MSYKVKTTTSFESLAKQIAKKHKGIKKDIENLIGDLEKIPTKVLI